jgi:hypothetical protein
VGEAEMILFVSRRQSARQADNLAIGYRDFLTRYGGVVLDASEDLPGIYMLDIMDIVELVGARGAYLLGVHQAPSAILARELVARLIANIEASGHEP